MSVYNGEKYLAPAVTSILGQSLTDWELIIVDDGSTDSTPAVLAAFADADSRIHVIGRDTNLGLSASLNQGLAIARGLYIARQDADDIALPDRLQYQADYLDRHTDIGLVGGSYRTIDEDGHILRRVTRNHDPDLARWIGQFRTPFLHSTVMFRADLLRELGLRYTVGAEPAEDFLLWRELQVRARCVNLPKPVLLYRVHGAGLSGSRRSLQHRKHLEFALGHLTLEYAPALVNEIEPFLTTYLDGESGSVRQLERALAAYATMFALYLAARPTLTLRSRVTLVREWLAFAAFVALVKSRAWRTWHGVAIMIAALTRHGTRAILSAVGLRNAPLALGR